MEDRKLIITAASGINDTNLPVLRKLALGLQEVHLTASGLCMPDMSYGIAKGAGMGFGSGEEWVIDRDKVRRVWDLIRKWNISDASDR